MSEIDRLPPIPCCQAIKMGFTPNQYNPDVQISRIRLFERWLRYAVRRYGRAIPGIGKG